MTPPDTERAHAAAHDAEPADDAAGLRLLKGTDDHLPRRQIVRDEIVATLREVFALYGFSPCETPILHYFDILASKYAGGAEILKETYRLTDQGGRELALRYDLTVPFARLVGMNHEGEIRLPFKRFEIGRVFRDGPVRSGRRREFYQCDVDMVGATEPFPDAELIILADQALRRLAIEARVEINHRGLLGAIMRRAGIESGRFAEAILSLDKLKKIGREGIAAELAEKAFTPAESDALLRLLDTPDGADNAGRLAHFRELLGGDAGAAAALDALGKMLAATAAAGVVLRVDFVPSLARGLDIYTGPIFEFFALDTSIVDGAIAAGGRYDAIVGSFLAEAAAAAGKQPAAESEFPTVGMSFGLEPLTAILVARQGPTPRETVAEALLVAMGGTEIEAQRLAAALRVEGVRLEVEYRQVRMKKCLQRCNALGMRFAVIVGEDEVREQQVSLKDLTTGEQRMLDVGAAAAIIRDARSVGAPPTS